MVRYRMYFVSSICDFYSVSVSHIIKALSGLHKIEIGLGTKFQDKFSAWFSRNFMLSGKAQNVPFILR